MTSEVAKSSESKPAGSTSAWEFFKVSFPVITALVTATLTFFVWLAQQRIGQKVDDNQALLEAQLRIQQTQLQAQLALKEEFYKRRLTIYEHACQQIAEAQTSLADLQPGGESSAQALNLVNELDKLRRANQLYWSKEVDVSLDHVWNLGICLVGPIPCEKEGKAIPPDDLPKEITEAVGHLHEQMKTDLNVLELAKALQQSGPPSKEAK